MTAVIHHVHKNTFHFAKGSVIAVLVQQRQCRCKTLLLMHTQLLSGRVIHFSTLVFIVMHCGTLFCMWGIIKF